MLVVYQQEVNVSNAPTLSRPVNALGGAMYGDGEYAVEFRNVRSFLAPMLADVLCPSGRIYVVEFGLGETAPSVALATTTLALVRAREERS